MQGFGHKKILFLSSILILLLAIGSSFAFYFLNKGALGKDVLAVVAGQKITEKDLKEKMYSLNFGGSVDEPSEQSEEEKQRLIEELVELKILENYAKKNNISVNDSELSEELKKRDVVLANLTETQQEITKKDAKNSILKEKVKNSLLGWKEGNYLLFRFDKYFDEKVSEIAQKGDATLIEEQRSYAERLSNTVYEDLKAKRTDFNKSLEYLKTDPKIGGLAFAPITPNVGGSFSRDDFLEGESYFNKDVYKKFKESVSTLKKGEISKPFLGERVSDNGEFKSFAYAVFIVEESGAGKVTDYNTWLNEQKKELGLKVFAKEGLNVTWENIFKTQQADASHSTVYDCPGVSGSHKANLKVQVQYRTAAGGWAYYYSPVRMTAGASTTGALLKCNTSGAGSTYAFTTVKYPDPNHYYYSDLKGSYDGFADSDRRYYIDCSKTSAASIFLPTTPPTISNASGGSWQVLKETTADNQWLKWVDNNSNDFSGYKTQVALDLGTSGNWANGTTVTKRVRWNPNFRPSTNLLGHKKSGDTVPPYNGNNYVYNFTTSTSVSLYADADDPNGSRVRSAIHYLERNIGATTWTDKGWVPMVSPAPDAAYGSSWSGLYSSDGASLTNNTAKAYGNITAVPGKEYAFRTKSKDESGLDSNGLTGYMFLKVQDASLPDPKHVSPSKNAAVTGTSVLLKAGATDLNGKAIVGMQLQQEISPGSNTWTGIGNVDSPDNSEASNTYPDYPYLDNPNGLTWGTQWRSYNTKDPSVKGAEATVTVIPGKKYRWRVTAADVKTVNGADTIGAWGIDKSEAGGIATNTAWTEWWNFTVATALACGTITTEPADASNPGGTLPFTVKFTSTPPTGGTGTIHYAWTVDGNAAGTDSSILNYTFTETGTFEVKVTVTDSGAPPKGCSVNVNIPVLPWSSGGQGEIAP